MLTPGNEVGTLLICKIFLSHRSRVTVLLGPELAFKTRNRVIMRNYQASAVKQMKTALFWVIIMRNYQASAVKQMKTALFWVIIMRNYQASAAKQMKTALFWVIIMRNYQDSAAKQMKTALFWVIIMRNYQASAAKQMKTALFWVITLRLVVISYRRFGTNKKFFGLLTPDYGTNRLSRNVG